MVKEGKSITAIAKQLGISRNTVYTDLAVTSKPSLKRTSVFDRYLPLIRSMMAGGSKSDDIEAACRKAGFDGYRNTLNYMIADERHDTRNKKPSTLNLNQHSYEFFGIKAFRAIRKHSNPCIPNF
ncbi:helix-turn-helix domain-containing protein [Peribacillus sp. B-H-3]|uniref:helix-turn-helix domain-containing protein n=1 Tax=Peribacillus sp. B-H-3 TaxID=3400420 RepID=UPI003B01998B